MASVEVLTKDDLVRAIQAARGRLLDRATGEEALAELLREIESPHDCEPIWGGWDDSLCQTCGADGPRA